jgi:hypothetical protein
MMVDWAKQNVLLRQGRGQYRVHPTFGDRKSWFSEATVAAVIAQYGGLATVPEVLKTLEALPSQNSHMRHGGRGNSKERTIRRKLPNMVSVHKVSLGASTSFLALSQDNLLQIPISGRAAEVMLQYQYLNALEKGGVGGARTKGELDEDVETHFVRVGLALRRIRRLFGHGLDSVAAVPQINEAIEWARWSSPELTREVSNEIRGRAKERAGEEGIEIGSARYEAILDEEEARYGAFVLDLMESGSAAAHRAASNGNWRANGRPCGWPPASRWRR